MPERFAIYYAPAACDPLWLHACAWLGRDPTGAPVAPARLVGISRSELDERSVSARRYGFHATLKAPMSLGFGHDHATLDTALRDFARSHAPVAIGPIKLTLIDGFLALVPVRQSPELTRFAAEVVEELDNFRAPPSAIERERRLKGGRLTVRQVELMERLGYPYVLEQFQLHMTLTDRLAEGERETLQVAAASHFGGLAGGEMLLDRLVLFHEPQAGAPFARLDDYVLEGARSP